MDNATPSFLSGMARVLDLFGVFDAPPPCHCDLCAAQADARAVYSDWRAVGEDISRAAAQHAAQQHE